MSGGGVVANPAEALARRVRDALGQFNNDDFPVTQLVNQLATDLAAAIARAEGVERDAARYRRLREMNNDNFAVFACRCGIPHSDGVLLGGHLDAATDRAIAAQQAEGE